MEDLKIKTYIGCRRSYFIGYINIFQTHSYWYINQYYLLVHKPTIYWYVNQYNLYLPIITIYCTQYPVPCIGT